jgi:superkiller protein 3
MIDKDYAIAYYNLGTVHYLLNEYEDAIKYLNKASLLMKEDADVYKYLGKSYSKVNDNANAIIAFNKSMNLRADANDAFQLGVLYYEMNQYEQAISQFQSALKQGKNKSESLYNMGLCYYGLKNYNEALQLFTEALDGTSDEKMVLFNIGSSQLQLKNYKEAILKLEQCIALDANYAKAYYLLGFAKYNTNKLNDAKAAFIRAHQLDPKYEMPDMVK